MRAILFLKQNKTKQKEWLGGIIDAINLIFTTPQQQIFKLKSSIKNVLNQKSITPKYLAKIADNFHLCILL